MKSKICLFTPKRPDQLWALRSPDSVGTEGAFPGE